MGGLALSSERNRREGCGRLNWQMTTARRAPTGGRLVCSMRWRRLAMLSCRRWRNATIKFLETRRNNAELWGVERGGWLARVGEWWLAS